MMICPKCNAVLETEFVRGVNATIEVDTCSSCGGTWFDKGELEQVDKIVEPVVFEIRNLSKKDEQLQTLSCPVCSKSTLMEKIEHRRDNKVIVDYCPQCNGIWLDKGELDAIQKENWLITVGRVYHWLLEKE